MIAQVTDTMVGIEGEALRGVTRVLVEEIASGAWSIGGNGLTTATHPPLAHSRTQHCR